MDFVHQYALLFVVALPVAIIAGLNVFLAMSGESGTLLLPSLFEFPSVGTTAEADDTRVSPPATTSVESANQGDYRQAA